ncbi:MAG: nucleotidyltransferase domain-containing protein [Candidatus Promineifilaceae bacterium]
MTTTHLPLGTERHQQVLDAIRDFYREDERVVQILLFGSLSRGNWDAYSDIDLDIILTDETAINAQDELRQLCAGIQSEHGFEALIIADVEEGDVVLSNLVEFSIRYHILSDTKPAILDSMRSIAGALSLDTIRASANDAHNAKRQEMTDSVNAYIRYTLGLHHAIMRQRVWMSMEILHRMRGLLMGMYAARHNAVRTIHLFDSQADSQLQQLLFNLSPQADLKSMEDAFITTISLLETHLDAFCDGAYQLSPTQIIFLDQLKQLPLYKKTGNITRSVDQ